ncbi:MAG: GNAT family N-acetyltransferase [Oceanicaulis sp.]
MKPQKVSVRSFGAEAAGLCAQLHAGGFDPGWSEAEMAGLLGSTGVEALILSEVETPLAVALIRTIAGESELLTIAVPEARRGEGLGARLLAACLDQARARGAEAMFLEVSEANAPARALYLRAGFIEVGRRPRYYRDGSDAALMRLAL